MHGNSDQNQKPHHLYEIWDKKAKETYKYGISQDPIDDDGLSRRVRDQVRQYNRVVGWIRFIGKILKTNIPGKRRAKELEEEHIEKFHKRKKRRPRGNPTRTVSKY